MNFLGGLRHGTNFVTPTFFWALLIIAVAISVVIVIGIGTGKFIAAGKAVNEPVHVVTACGINGHRYRVHNTGWRCTTCGEGVLHEGELVDRVKDGAASAPRASTRRRELVGGRRR
jgi:hypothetical protein